MHQADWHVTKMGCHMLGEALKHLEGRLEQSISLEVLERDCRSSLEVLQKQYSCCCLAFSHEETGSAAMHKSMLVFNGKTT